MDLYRSINILQYTYQKLASYQNISPGFGIIVEKYESKGRSSLIIIILGPPKSHGRGKEKEFEKLIQKSQGSNKFINPKDLIAILPYFTDIFGSIIRPRNEILSLLKLLISGLRIGFVPYQNMKLSFLNPKNPQILVFNEEINQQFVFYVHILDLKEDGLFLAHEKQIIFLSEMIDKNQDITKITSLPPLRTGETEIEGYGDSEELKDQEQREAVARFRDRMQQKKLQSEKEQELGYQTVVDFSKTTPSPEESGSVNSEAGFSDNESVVSPSIVPLPPESPLPKPPPMPLTPMQSFFTPSTENKGTTNQQHIDHKIEPENQTQIEEELKVMKAKYQNYDDLLQENEHLKIQLETFVDSLTKQLEMKDLTLKSLTDNLNELQKQYNALLLEKTALESKIIQLQNFSPHIKDNNQDHDSISSTGQLNVAMKEAMKKQQENLQKMKEKD